jgi:ABC-type nitrate/sulfonate/bicarbonate transport system permease component
MPGGRALLGLSGLAGLLVLVELLPRAGIVSQSYLPPTSRILAALADEAVTAGSGWRSRTP